MAIYFANDIKTDLSGDISLSSKGDIALNNTTETMFQQIAFRLRTSPNGFTAPDIDIGSNLEIFIGEYLNEDLLLEIERQVKLSLTNDLINKEDLMVTAVPIDQDEILLYVKAKGLYVNQDGEAESGGIEGIFSFPIYEGTPIQMINYQELE